MHEPPTGERIRLLDVTPDTVNLLISLQRGQAGGFNDFGIERQAPPAEAFTEGRLRSDRKGTFLIERRADGALIGSISYSAVEHGPGVPSRAWRIGIDLVPEGRGQGFGTDAQRLFAAWLFETTDANRVEASTDVENLVEARSLEKAGFTREGVARGAQFRAGTYHDLALYGRLRFDQVD